jgi:hypothetical protein
MAGIDELAIVARQRLEPAIGGFDEYLRLVACQPQGPLDPQDFVTDRVAVPKRREHLMNRRPAA